MTPEEAISVIATRLPALSKDGGSNSRELRRAMQWITAHVRTPAQLRRAERNVALHKFLSGGAGGAASEGAATPEVATVATVQEENDALASELARLESRRRYLHQRIDATMTAASLATSFNARLSGIDFRLRSPLRQLAHYKNTLCPMKKTATVAWQDADTMEELMDYLDDNAPSARMATDGPEGDFDVAAIASDATAPRLDAEELAQWLLRTSYRDMRAVHQFQAKKRNTLGLEKYLREILHIPVPLAKTSDNYEGGDGGGHGSEEERESTLTKQLRNPLSEQVHALRRQHVQRSLSAASASNEMAEIVAEIDTLRKRRFEDLQATLGADRAKLTLAQEAAAQELYGLREALCEGRRRIAELSENVADRGDVENKNEEENAIKMSESTLDRTAIHVDRPSAIALVNHNIGLVDTCEKTLCASERDIRETQHLGRMMLSLSQSDGDPNAYGNGIGSVCRAELQLAGKLVNARTTHARDLARPFRGGWIENNSVIASALKSSSGVQEWMSSERMHAAMVESKTALSRLRLASQTSQLQLREAAGIPEMSSAADKKVRGVVTAVRASHNALNVKLGESLESRVASTRQHLDALAKTLASTVQP